jgi:pectate lyase
MDCGAGCIDLASDNANCGGCGLGCRPGEQCQAMSCACLPGLTTCTDGCTDTRSDPFNCGRCGQPCPTDQVCSSGACAIGCGAAETECNFACVDLNSSAQHCGQCGRGCPSGQECAGGDCACTGGLATCSGQCVDTSSNDTHCGRCDNPCVGGQSCSNGSCQCPDGQTPCNGSCVNTSDNAAHCGTCGNACASGSCSSGTCAPATTGVIGWASVSGDSVATTTGGQGGSTQQVNSASALQSAVSGSTARIVEITGNISIGELDIGSNKTIVGIGANVTLSGGINISDERNVIIQNLHINARSSTAGGGDGIHIQRSHHIWVDHVEIYDAPDGNLDINDASNWVTVSWSKFRYSSNPPAADHRYSNLVGSGPAATQDRNRLKITYHHNWWVERIHERMPRVRFGQVHVFNNYYTSSGNNYCIRAGIEADIRIENNYFEGVGKPHEVDDGEGRATAVTSSGNEYPGSSGARDTRGTAFSPPYAYSAESASSARSAVQANAGPQ